MHKKIKPIGFAVGCLGLLIISVACQSCSSPEKSDYDPFLVQQARANRHGLISQGFPKVQISLDSSLIHMGSETFILYDVARCEIHLYAELDDDKRFKRIYWFQFESYLPGPLLPFRLRLIGKKPRYDYSNDPYQTEIGGRSFFTRSSYLNFDFTDDELNAGNGPEDSDFMHVMRLLHKNGVGVKGKVLGTRMVLLDETRQKELMIICYERLTDDNMISVLDEEGKEWDLWENVSRDLIQRVERGMRIDFID